MWLPSNPVRLRNSQCLNRRENLPTFMNFTSGSSASFSCEDWRKIPLLSVAGGGTNKHSERYQDILFSLTRTALKGNYFTKASMTRAKRSTLLQPLLVLNVGDRKHPRQAQ